MSGLFGTIVMVTNQRGVGKGLMSEADLSGIHDFMVTEIIKAGGRLDRIYYSTGLDNTCEERKPNPGMAHLAKKDFPAIGFSKSIMVGNKLSDMEFGRNAGMFTVFVSTTHPETPFPHPAIDLRFADLYAFAQACKPVQIPEK
ncbi:MAG: family hydrolase [Chitinophagaceae bacterium]|nr:family hydrolase [Chitinophagaceae bacterium]